MFLEKIALFLRFASTFSVPNQFGSEVVDDGFRHHATMRGFYGVF
jgi:hypothetical protein